MERRSSSSSSNNKKLIKSIVRSKISYIQATIYITLVVIFVLNLTALVLETKDEFDLQKLDSLVDKELLSDTISSMIDYIHQRLHVTLVCNVFILVLLCVLFIFTSLSVVYKPKTIEEEEEDLLNKSGSLSQSEKGSIMLESTLHEPYNTITIERISGMDGAPSEKIKSTYYRYGLGAARQIYERVYKDLNQEDLKEIYFIMNANTSLSAMTNHNSSNNSNSIPSIPSGISTNNNNSSNNNSQFENNSNHHNGSPSSAPSTSTSNYQSFNSLI